MNFTLNLFLVFIMLSLNIARAEEYKAVAVSSGELSWKKLSDKVWFSSISGQESTPGMYVYRVRFEKGHKVEPHYHTDERVVTVLSGSIYVGYGMEFKESEMVKLSVGGAYTEPKKYPHYVWAKDGDVELQVVGSGSSRRVSIGE